MYRFLTLVPCLLALLLAGCPSMTTAPELSETEPVPELEVAHSISIYLFEAGVQFLAFSEDGNTFVAGGKHDGVGLFRTDDFTLLERHYEGDKSHTEFGIKMSKKIADTISAGYFDKNTWYFMVVPISPNPEERSPSEPEQAITHVRTIQPSQEVARYTSEHRNKDVVAHNKNYFVYSSDGLNGTLVNWRSGEKYPIKTIEAHRGIFEVFELTHSNRVLSATGWAKLEKPMLDDPLHQQTQILEGYVTFSPDERYGVDLNGARCTLLEFHGKKVTPLKEQKIVGHCSGLTWGSKEKNVMFSPDGTMFAVAVDRDVRVYRVDPFQLVFKREVAGVVGSLALSDAGWLVTVDETGFLRAWDVATGRLAGQRRFLDGNGNPRSSFLLAIQPGGDKLLVNQDGLTVFKLPER
jgi:WD40 repeat protein